MSAAASPSLRPASAAVGVTIAVAGDPDRERVVALVRGLEREVIDAAVARLDALVAGEPPAPVVLMWSAGPLDPAACAAVVAWAAARTPPPGLVAWSAAGTRADAEVALEAGFDDVVGDGCSPRELAARIRAIHRRVHWKRRAGRLRHAGMMLDTDTHELWIGRRVVRLTATETAVLCALMRARGRAISRAELLDLAWGGADLEISERAVDNVILRLRRKLGEAGRIQTVRAVGFRIAEP